MAHSFNKKWRSNDVRLEEQADFSALLLSKSVLNGLNRAGFKNPSPIQLKAIPLARFGSSLMVQAKSGTGKTLVFVIAALEMLKRKVSEPQVLIITPTREIATQICSVVKSVGSSFRNLTVDSFIGGLPVFADQEKALETQIVVGTPGRLKHLIQKQALPVKLIDLLVLDEADELLDNPTFKDDIHDIITVLPDVKQVIATSATYNSDVEKAMVKYLGVYEEIRLDVEHLALLGMIHYATVVDYCPVNIITYRDKQAALERILKTVRFAQCLVFCNGVSRVQLLYNDIKKIGFSVAYISSAKEQRDRLKAIERLRRFKCKVLVSSNLTARGIDAENVDLVINFDLAHTPEIYMHRVGRAGRYGSIATAISIIDDKELRHLKVIEQEGSFKTFKLPDPIPSDLILYPREEEFVIDESYSENVDAGSEATQSAMYNNGLWNAFKDDEYDLEKVNTDTNVDEDNACESELAAADGEKGDPEKEIDEENIQVKDVFETCTGVDDTIKYVSSKLAVDAKPHDDNTKHNEEWEKIDEDVISHSKNKYIHFNEQMSDKILQKGYANNDSIKQDKNMNSNLLNDSDENGLIASKSTDKPSDIQENSDFCEKNAFGKQALENSIKNDTQFFETDNSKLSKIHTDNIPESCEPKDIALNLKDDSDNCEQENDAKSCEIEKDISKLTTDEADCKPIIQNKLSQLFQEFYDSDLYTSETDEETSEVAKETSSISSASDSLSSDSESSSSSDSEDESGSETSSESSSESSSDYSDSSKNENEESYNYSRTGRQNPSLVSGSVRGQVLNDRVYCDKYCEDCRFTSCGGRKKEIPRGTLNFSRVVRNPPHFFDHREISSCSRNATGYHNNQSSLPKKHSSCHNCKCPSGNVTREGGESFFPRKHSRFHNCKRASRNVTRGRGESSFPRKHSGCHNCNNSSRNVTREGGESSFPRNHSGCHSCNNSSRNITRGGGDQSRRACLMHQRSSRHHNTLNCVFTCHPSSPCRYGPQYEMYKTFYSHWLHVDQSMALMNAFI